MNKFKVGDLVRCIDNDCMENILREGCTYTVSGVDRAGLNLLETGGLIYDFSERRFVLASDNDQPSNDVINNPPHYQIMPGVEVIHVRRALLDKIPTGTNLNAVDEQSRSWEYLTRAWSKNGLQDFKKAQVYLGWLIERLESEDKNN